MNLEVREILDRAKRHLANQIADLPFKTGDASIVIVRALPVLQCRQCGEIELENIAMARVDLLLAAGD